MRSYNNSSSYDVDIIVFIWYCEKWKKNTNKNVENLILLLKRHNVPFPNVVFPVWRYPFKLGWWFHLFKLVKEKMAAEGSSARYNLR